MLLMTVSPRHMNPNPQPEFFVKYQDLSIKNGVVTLLLVGYIAADLHFDNVARALLACAGQRAALYLSWSTHMQGLCRARPEDYPTELSLFQLWVHETDRVFADRLLADDIQKFEEIRTSVATMTFGDRMQA